MGGRGAWDYFLLIQLQKLLPEARKTGKMSGKRTPTKPDSSAGPVFYWNVPIDTTAIPVNVSRLSSDTDRIAGDYKPNSNVEWGPRCHSCKNFVRVLVKTTDDWPVVFHLRFYPRGDARREPKVCGEIRFFNPVSSSRRIGWLIKISRAVRQRYLISYSSSCTGFPGRDPRTSTA